MVRPRSEIRDGQKRCSKCKQWLALSAFGADKRTSTGRSSACIKCRDLGRFYGITRDEYAHTLAEQHGVCAICGEDASAGGREHLAVDHDHATGKIRGLLCSRCNTALGSFRDRVDLLDSARAYLLDWQARHSQASDESKVIRYTHAARKMRVQIM